MSRLILDLVVALVHGTVVVSTNAIWAGFAKTTAGALLIAVECIAAVFHVAYCALYLYADNRPGGGLSRVERNPLKWAEYAITATMATVAMLYADPQTEPDPSLVVVIVAAGVCQQSQGFILENSKVDKVAVISFTVALVVQLAEFAAVVITNTRGGGTGWEPIVAVYIMTYLIFGALAFAVRWEFPDNFTVHVPENSEIIYSIIGALAKVTIYLAEFLYLYDVKSGPLVLSGAVVLLIATIVVWGRQRFRS